VTTPEVPASVPATIGTPAFESFYQIFMKRNDIIKIRNIFRTGVVVVLV
jgi:hypothetical protein